MRLLLFFFLFLSFQCFSQEPAIRYQTKVDTFPDVHFVITDERPDELIRMKPVDPSKDSVFVLLPLIGFQKAERVIERYKCIYDQTGYYEDLMFYGRTQFFIKGIEVFPVFFREANVIRFSDLIFKQDTIWGN